MYSATLLFFVPLSAAEVVRYPIPFDTDQPTYVFACSQKKNPFLLNKFSLALSLCKSFSRARAQECSSACCVTSTQRLNSKFRLIMSMNARTSRYDYCARGGLRDEIFADVVRCLLFALDYSIPRWLRSL